MLQHLLVQSARRLLLRVKAQTGVAAMLVRCAAHKLSAGWFPSQLSVKVSRRAVCSVLMYMLGRQSVSSATPDCPWQGPFAVPDCPWVESSCLHCRANMDSPAVKRARRQSGASSITSAPAAECTEGALDEMPTAAGSPAANGAAEEVLPGEGAAPLNMLTLHRWS